MNELVLTVVGNLTAAPELRFTPAGVAVCRFTIAHNPRRLDRASGEWRDGEPTFLDAVAWRQLAENIAESLTAGARVVAVGTLSTQRWESDGSGKTPAGQTLTRQQLAVTAAGAELSYATATVRKSSRRSGEQDPSDPWATATRERPAPTAAAAPARFDDEPPF